MKGQIMIDPVLFVVSTMFVALKENKEVRNHAGKLLDSLNRKKNYQRVQLNPGKQYKKVIEIIFYMLVNCFSVDKVLNDSGTKKEYPNLSNLVSYIVLYQSKH